MSILPFYPNMPKAVCPWNPTRSDPLLDLRSGTAAPKTPHMINEKYMAMQICEKQYQSLNISASPSFVSAQGRENGLQKAVSATRPGYTTNGHII